MGRTVARHSRAVYTAFVDTMEFEGHWEYEHLFLENVISSLQSRFPSFHDERDCDKWPEREVRRIAGNGHAIVTVSEYCGLSSLCLVPRDHHDSFGWRDERRRALAESWCWSITESFRDCIPYPVMIQKGTMSNGVGVYAEAG